MKKAIAHYKAQKNSAENRSISFELTFDEWYNWWLKHGIDKNLSQGKRNKTTLCMCRYGDIGPYSLDNIYCATSSQNSKDMTNRFCMKRKIQTPQGIFDTITKWANFLKVRPLKFYQLRNKHPLRF